MIRKRSVQLIFKAVFCTLGLIAFLMTLGVFDRRLDRNYHVYYTHLSNALCLGFMLCSLVRTAVAAERQGSGFCDFAPRLKFMLTVMILITCIVYNTLLSNYRSVGAYFASLKNGLNHFILPVMFFLDWLLFYERRRVKWTYPLLGVIIPLTYVLYILLRAAVLKATGKYARVVYPYFFINPDALGWNGFLRWILILLAAVLALGYGIYLLDKWPGRKKAAAEKV